MLCLYRNTVNLADLWQSHKKGLFRIKLTQSNFFKGDSSRGSEEEKSRAGRI